MITFVRPEPPSLMLTGAALEIYSAHARRAAGAWEEYRQAVFRLVALLDAEGDMTASRVLSLLGERASVLRIQRRIVIELPRAWWEYTSAENGVRLRDRDITLTDWVKHLVIQYLNNLIALGIAQPDDMQRWEDPGLWEKLQQMGA